MSHNPALLCILGLTIDQYYFSPAPARQFQTIDLEAGFQLPAAVCCKVGRLHIRTLMKRMGVEAIYRPANTRSPRRVTKPTHISCVSCRSRRQIRFERWILRIYRWHVALFIWLPLSTGSAAGDSKSAWRDNIFVERLWRTIKYEAVYLHAYAMTKPQWRSQLYYFNTARSKRGESSLSNSKALLSGLVRRKGCGKPLMMPTGKGGAYCYYKCSGKH